MVAPSRGIESLKVAARWPGADRATIITLATRLASVRADADGYAYFQQEADAHPGQALPLPRPGFPRPGRGTDADPPRPSRDRGAQSALAPPQYFRGLALVALPPSPKRAEQAAADLEFVLAVRDQFPLVLIRAAYR